MIIFAGVEPLNFYGEDHYDNDAYPAGIIYRIAKGGHIKWSDSLYRRIYDHVNTREDVEHYVSRLWREGIAKAVFLGAFGTGVRVILKAAQNLKSQNIPIEGMLLIDPVRCFPPGDIPVADTVKDVICPVRNVLQTMSKPSLMPLDITSQMSPNTTLHYKNFFGTYAALSGRPWHKANPSQPESTRGTIWEPDEPRPTNVTLETDKAESQSAWSWTLVRVWDAHSRCKARLSKQSAQPKVAPSVGGQLPAQPGNNAPGNGGGKQRIHIVQPGDWLSKIALKYYGDAMKYKVIHEANLDVIGPNPDIIKPGQKLVIPYI